MNLFKKFIPIVQKGKINGVATLDASGHLEWAQLPDGLSGGMSYQGLLDASAGSYPLVPVNHAAPILSGDYWKVSVGGNLVGSHGIKKSITKAETSGGGLDTKFTCASHGYHNADVIWISGTTSYNGLRTVSSVTANTFIVTGLAFVANETGYGQETETTTWVAGDLCIWNNLSWDKMSDADLPVIVPFNHSYYVDGSRVDPYTEDGSISRPYKKISTCQTAINAVAATLYGSAANYELCKFIVNIQPGKYTDNINIQTARYLRYEMNGVEISGNITITQEQLGLADYYGKVEFVGGAGNRPYRGNCGLISGDILFQKTAFTSLAYDAFVGINITGNVSYGTTASPTHGTWVLCLVNAYFQNSAKFIESHFIDPTEHVMIESYGYNKILSHLSGQDGSAVEMTLYDCNNTYFDLINIIPLENCLVKNCTFNSTTSVAAAKTLSIDSNSLVSLRAQTPTLTGMSLNQLDSQPLFKNSTDAVGVTENVYKSEGNYGTPLAVVTGDNVYTQNFWLHDGTNYLNMAGIEVEAAGTIAATQTPTNMLFKVATNTTPSVKSTALKLWYNLRATFYGDIYSSSSTQINAMFDDIQVTPTDKLFIWNSQAATAGVPNQYSPALNFFNHVWNSTGGGTDETQNWRFYSVPVSGATPTSTFLGRYSANGAAYSTVFSFSNSGTLTVANLDTATTIGSAYIYRAGGTDVPVTDGGTGFSACVLGDMIAGSGANTMQVVAPNTTVTRKYLSMLGDGVNGAAPTWEVVSGSNWQKTLTVLSPLVAGDTVNIPINALGATYSAGLTLSNNTSSLVGAVTEYAPSLNFLGHVKNTTGAGSDETSEWRMGARVTSSTTPSGTWYLRYSANGGAYSDKLTVTSDGDLSFRALTLVRGIKVGSGYTIDNANNVARGSIEIMSNGIEINRNMDGAYPAMITNHKNAGASVTTIHAFHWQSILRAYVSKEGNYLSYANSTDAVGRQINFLKSRGTLAAKTICASADVAGYVSGWHYDGANDLETSRIVLSSYSASIGATRIGGVYELWLRPDSAGGSLAKVFDVASNGNATFTGKLTSTQRGFAEMYMYDNVTACVIDTANVYHAVYNSFGNNDGTLAPVIDTTEWTYKAGATYAITSVTDPGGGTTITCVTAGHSLLAGEPITITNSANYNGIYLVLAAGLTATEFRVTKAYVADNTGSARKPATLKCLVAGTFRASFTASGTAVSANDVVKFELNKDTTPLDNISGRNLWDSGTNYQSCTGIGLCTLTANQYVWLSVKNYSGTGDLTINNANVSLTRV